MEFLKNLTNAASKLGATLDNIFKGVEQTTKDKMDAARDTHSLTSKEAALQVITDARVSAHSDLARLGYYRALGEMAADAARRLGATEEEIGEARAQGATKGSTLDDLNQRGR